MIKTEILFVVDNSIDELEIAQRHFELVGVETRLFEYATDCYKYIMSGNHAHAVVVDFRLNSDDMLAVDFIRAVKDIVPCIICATSLFDNDEIRRELYDAGATDVKPKNYKLIANSICSIMTRRAMKEAEA